MVSRVLSAELRRLPVHGDLQPGAAARGAVALTVAAAAALVIGAAAAAVFVAAATAREVKVQELHPHLTGAQARLDGEAAVADAGLRLELGIGGLQ